MNEAQIQRAVERLYEDPSLRDELIDDEASVLLGWAEDQTIRLAESVPDEAQFDQQFTILRKMITAVNRFIGYRNSMSDSDRQTRLNEIADAARSLGCPVPSEALAAYNRQVGALDNVAAIRSLTALIAPSKGAPAIAPPFQPVLQALSDLLNQITYSQPDAGAPASMQGDEDPHDETEQ